MYLITKLHNNLLLQPFNLEMSMMWCFIYFHKNIFVYQSKIDFVYGNAKKFSVCFRGNAQVYCRAIEQHQSSASVYKPTICGLQEFRKVRRPPAPQTSAAPLHRWPPITLLFWCTLFCSFIIFFCFILITIFSFLQSTPFFTLDSHCEGIKINCFLLKWFNILTWQLSGKKNY